MVLWFPIMLLRILELFMSLFLAGFFCKLSFQFSQPHRHKLLLRFFLRNNLLHVNLLPLQLSIRLKFGPEAVGHVSFHTFRQNRPTAQNIWNLLGVMSAVGLGDLVECVAQVRGNLATGREE